MENNMHSLCAVNIFWENVIVNQYETLSNK